MFIKGSTGKFQDIMKRSMDVAVLRRNVIADNISNADTPNFKRMEVNFEANLKRALDSEKVKKLPNLMSDSRHISFNRPDNYRDVKPRLNWDYMTTADNNGNNVDVEVEMMHAMENQLMYQTLAQVVQDSYSRMSIVLK